MGEPRKLVLSIKILIKCWENSLNKEQRKRCILSREIHENCPECLGNSACEEEGDKSYGEKRGVKIAGAIGFPM